MCAYTALNGVPSCADGRFLNDVVRGAWGASGDGIAVVSDCGAIREIWKDYNYTRTNETAVGAALHGGCDFECGGTFNNYIVKALDAGVITMADLQQAARRMLRLAFRAGLLDPVERQLPLLTLSAADVDTPRARQLAFEAAVQSIVLLVNRAAPNATSPSSPLSSAPMPLLPLRTGAALRRLAVIGPLINVTTTLLGSYFGANILVGAQSVLMALERRGARDGFTVASAVGCDSVACNTSAGFADAAAAARGADAAVVVLGLCADSCPGGDADGAVHEGEGVDRPHTDLPGLQNALLQAIAAVGVPVVLVLVHGGALSIDWAAGPASGVSAILSAGYPGELGGDAVAAVLLGDVSPSARTTTTWYTSAWQAQRPLIVDIGLEPRAEVTGITYLYANASLVLFPFGTGLSYTTFSFSWLDGGVRRELSARHLVDDPPSFAVNVTNTGSLASDVTALAFVSSAEPGEPARKCFDFSRAAALAPGASVVLHFTLPPLVAARVSAHGRQAVAPGALTVTVGGDGSGGGAISRELVVVGAESVVLFDLAAVGSGARGGVP